MSVQLLDKTRKINKLLHNNNSSKVVFNDICAVLTEILDSNVLVVSRKGKILGVSKSPDVQRKTLKHSFYNRICESGDTWIFSRGGAGVPGNRNSD